MMNLQLRQRREKEKRSAVPRRSHCRKCKSTNLLTEGPDQFCGDCDWDTCLEYVQRGLMNNLEVAFKEQFLMPKEISIQTKIASDLEKSA